MMYMNRVQLVGVVGNDAELREVGEGRRKTCSVRLVTANYYKDRAGQVQEEAEWHTCVAWNEVAEWLSRARKGDWYFVEGRIKSREAAGADGKTRIHREIVCERVMSIKSKKDAQSGQAIAEEAPPEVPIEPGSGFQKMPGFVM